MSKKILIISSLVLVIFIITLAGYYFLLQSETKMSQGEKPSFADFFPFGNNNEPINQNTETNNTNNEQNIDTNTNNFEKKLRLISKEPVSGFGFVENTNGSIIRYLEKATGHIYDAPTYSNNINRISNTTIPKIQEVYFTNNGKEILAQYQTDNNFIETFYASITSTSTEKALSGSILNGEVVNISVSPQGNIFYLENNQNGSIGSISTIKNRVRKNVWSFPLKDFYSDFIDENNVILTTKTSASTSGFTYTLNINTGKLTPVLQNITGLTTKAGNGNIVFSNENRFFHYSMKTNSQTEMSPKTFPDKCVFDKTKTDIFYCAVPKSNINRSVLDLWYMGMTELSDDIWVYNAEEDTSKRLVDLKEEAGENIDIDKMDINKNGDFLIFRNKINGNLWSLKVE